ncbi:hypothetical protein [Mycoplasma crocodyli]|uniref:Uncharacterized protein n=1 Tax=Mycoplasma crocodyli (strain ATCC 51981 / MP145) TaxID=512564 RepID=D5E4X6_MYCCM|nr:hypothetical protein [Mycoplasma crocodyli]ADE19991.1 hypothetical protein MCRO_0148 [Mycoplasma crocodyli MP145]
MKKITKKILLTSSISAISLISIITVGTSYKNEKNDIVDKVQYMKNINTSNHKIYLTWDSFDELIIKRQLRPAFQEKIRPRIREILTDEVLGVLYNFEFAIQGWMSFDNTYEGSVMAHLSSTYRDNYYNSGNYKVRLEPEFDENLKFTGFKDVRSISKKLNNQVRPNGHTYIVYFNDGRDEWISFDNKHHLLELYINHQNNTINEYAEKLVDYLVEKMRDYVENRLTKIGKENLRFLDSDFYQIHNFEIYTNESIEIFNKNVNILKNQLNNGERKAFNISNFIKEELSKMETNKNFIIKKIEEQINEVSNDQARKDWLTGICNQTKEMQDFDNKYKEYMIGFITPNKSVATTETKPVQPTYVQTSDEQPKLSVWRLIVFLAGIATGIGLVIFFIVFLIKRNKKKKLNAHQKVEQSPSENKELAPDEQLEKNEEPNKQNEKNNSN